jgi:hypothetical protein
MNISIALCDCVDGLKIVQKLYLELPKKPFMGAVYTVIVQRKCWFAIVSSVTNRKPLRVV